MYFFVYVMYRDGKLQPIIVEGPTEEGLDETRRLVGSGSQVHELYYLGPVTRLVTRHQRRSEGDLDA